MESNLSLKVNVDGLQISYYLSSLRQNLLNTDSKNNITSLMLKSNVYSFNDELPHNSKTVRVTYLKDELAV